MATSLVNQNTIYQTQGFIEAFKCGNVNVDVGTLQVKKISGGNIKVDVYESNEITQPTSIAQMTFSQTIGEGNHQYTKPFRWIAFVPNQGVAELHHFQLVAV